LSRVNGNSFIVAGGRLRPIWKFILSTLSVLFVYLFAGFFYVAAVHVLGFSQNLFISLFIVNSLMLVGLLGIYKLFCAVADDKPLAFAGLGFRGRWKQELGTGLALGAMMILAVAALERAFGAASFSFIPSAGAQGQQLALWAGISMVVFSVAGTAEELTFRGYPFQRLADSIGPIGATAVFAALFGLVHLGNSFHTWISTCNTMLVGVTFAAAYFRTRSLWLPLGLHIAWNIVQGYVLGLPVSGILLPASLVRPQVTGAAFLTGGAYGPEGGVLTTGVFVAATVYLLFSKRIYVSREVRELVFGQDPPQGGEPKADPSPLPTAGGES
jgi:CAAX protease family protein